MIQLVHQSYGGFDTVLSAQPWETGARNAWSVVTGILRVADSEKGEDAID